LAKRKKLTARQKRLLRFYKRTPWTLLATLFPITFLICFHLLWNWNATLAFSDLHSGAASWAQAIGTVAAICVAILVPIHERNRQIKNARTLAEMQVAAGLRSWLRVCASEVQELQLHRDTNGQQGSDSILLPGFTFSMDRVAEMSLRHARKMYSIIEQRERGIGRVANAVLLVDRESAETEYFTECAKLFRRCRWRYIVIARETGLYDFTSEPWELRVMDKAAEEGGVQRWVRLGKEKFR
jgi:hypothetical protein